MACKVYRKDKYGNELTVDQMLKRFNKNVERDGIIQAYRDHMEFLPKSLKRAEKSKRHARVLRKMAKKAEKHQDR